MNKYIIIILLCAGCSQRYNIYAIDKEDMLRIPVAGATIEWDDSDGIPGDLFYTGNPGWFLADEILDKIYEAEAQEDLTPSIWDRAWRMLGL